MTLLRQSITFSCVADHQNDAATLARWLANKTPEQFNGWCANLDSRVFVATLETELAGVAALHGSGEVRLCYVDPRFAQRGVGSALVRALERQARAWELTVLRLKSTHTARRFYERCGFTASGEPSSSFGVLLGYPYEKVLTRVPVPPASDPANAGRDPAL